jgi:hypothetical protein
MNPICFNASVGSGKVFDAGVSLGATVGMGVFVGIEVSVGCGVSVAAGVGVFAAWLAPQPDKNNETEHITVKYITIFFIFLLCFFNVQIFNIQFLQMWDSHGTHVLSHAFYYVYQLGILFLSSKSPFSLASSLAEVNPLRSSRRPAFLVIARL